MKNMETEEIWKPIERFPYYWVSSYGRVRTLDRLSKARIRKNKKYSPVYVFLKLFVNINGYLVTFIYNEECRKTVPIHTLVCQSFIGPRPDNTIQINHKNGIKTDNIPDNLEYCTASYNVKHAYDTNLTKNRRKGINNWKSRRVGCSLEKGGEQTGAFDCISEAARKVNCCQSAISAALKRESKSSGLFWFYL